MPLPEAINERQLYGLCYALRRQVSPGRKKLSVAAEPNIVNQVSKYVYNSKVFLTDDGSRVVTGADFHPGKVMIIDTEHIFMFDSKTQTVNQIKDLDQIASKADLYSVEQVIRKNLS